MLVAEVVAGELARALDLPGADAWVFTLRSWSCGGSNRAD